MTIPDATPRDGLLLIGHGTRSLAGQEELRTAATRVAALSPGSLVQPCFLELAEPSIAKGMALAYRAGVRRLTVAPLLTFAAGHANRDIPLAVATAAAEYSDFEIVGQTLPLLCHEAMLWLSELRYRQALSGLPPVPAAETMLVMIGRGSSEPAATAEMHRFAGLRCQRTPVGRLEVGFMAMQKPSLEDVLERASGATGMRRIVVQPHLLFQGELLQEIREAVLCAASTNPSRQWIVVPHLGPGWPLARAIVDRARIVRNPAAAPDQTIGSMEAKAPAGHR
ncbi:MAG: sirohydrochlorin chelatase [Planctomycetia bacterium]|nr:sirohydrochlorin chelatase [Planctomycetia bacterium]